ncbi:TPA: hypothetical protein EYO12_04210 [Candidatus Saccharibacteria bacterium]|nr:hypothetical protein [Candidatus Saccharibacteria bacterium]HIO87761.1 hypothetical protein [Candidatus Saccharibacteria bacterium]
MKRITHQQIQKLAQKNIHPSVSIYMPLLGDYYDIRESGLRLLKQARDNLMDFVSYEEARQILAPAYEAMHNRNKWVHEDYEGGAAMFIDETGVETYAFPDMERERVYVGHGFEVAPLFEQLVQHGRFYTLSITSRFAELYLNDVKGSHKKVRLTNKRAFADKGGSRNLYSKRLAGDTSAFPKRYLSQLDKAVRKAIEDKTAPLITIGLPKAQSAFRSTSKYDLLMPDGVQVNPEAVKQSEVVQRAAPIAQRFYGYYEKAAQEEFARRQATDQPHVVTGMRQVLEALREGKVRTLFIDPKKAVWGEPLTKAIHTKRQRGDENLTNLAVRRALNSKAEIFHPSVDNPKLVSAILRY